MSAPGKEQEPPCCRAGGLGELGLKFASERHVESSRFDAQRHRGKAWAYHAVEELGQTPGEGPGAWAQPAGTTPQDQRVTKGAALVWETQGLGQTGESRKQTQRQPGLS